MPPIGHIYHEIARPLQHQFRKEAEEVYVAAVPVDDEDFLQAITRDLLTHIVQQVQHQLTPYSHCTRLMLCFEDLAEVVPGENDGRFLLGGAKGDFAGR